MKTIFAYRGITARNIKVYLKDKFTIVISMLTQIIILALYLLFLKNNYVEGVCESINEFGNLDNIITDSHINAIVNSWLVSGVIGTSLITVALNSLSVMVSDKQGKINYDYGAAPVKGYVVVLSYFSGAAINTFFVSSILTTAGLLFLYFLNGVEYTFVQLLSIYGIIALGAISATLILMAVASFFKKSSTLGAFGIMVSAAIGFIIGAYIPVSQFSRGVQTAVNLVPGSQIAGMIRNMLMNPAINNVDAALDGLDKGAFTENMNTMFSLKMQMCGNEVGFNFMMIFSLSVIALFLLINLVLYKFSSKSK